MRVLIGAGVVVAVIAAVLVARAGDDGRTYRGFVQVAGNCAAGPVELGEAVTLTNRQGKPIADGEITEADGCRFFYEIPDAPILERYTVIVGAYSVQDIDQDDIDYVDTGDGGAYWLPPLLIQAAG